MKWERWRPILRFKGFYEVSNFGRIRRLDSYIPHSSTGKLFLKKGGVRKISSHPSGYSIIRLCKDGKCSTKKVHRLVAEAFLKNPNNLEEVHHKNFKRDDNRSRNLKWMTHKDNCKASSDNYRKFGSSNGNSKLTNPQVKRLRSLASKGKTTKQLSNEFGLCCSGIRKIVRGEYYSEVR